MGNLVSAWRKTWPLGGAAAAGRWGCCSCPAAAATPAHKVHPDQKEAATGRTEPGLSGAHLQVGITSQVQSQTEAATSKTGPGLAGAHLQVRIAASSIPNRSCYRQNRTRPPRSSSPGKNSLSRSIPNRACYRQNRTRPPRSSSPGKKSLSRSIPNRGCYRQNRTRPPRSSSPGKNSLSRSIPNRACYRQNRSSFPGKKIFPSSTPNSICLSA